MLRPADVHLEASYLTCTGKGEKQRIVPIGDEAAAWVKRYLQEARGFDYASAVLRSLRGSNRRSSVTPATRSTASSTSRTENPRP